MRPRIVIPALLAAACLGLPAAQAWDTNDWQFLETIERANLRFFQEQKRGPYMLLVDHTDYDATVTNTWVPNSSVAGIGFELTAICLGHYRGWISYSNAYEQALLQVRAFNGLLSSDPLVFHRENGWTHHMYWIDGPDAGRQYAGIDELSMLDHSFFIAGCIFVSEYFKGTEAAELAHRLYDRTTWSWRPNTDYNFGYSENLLCIIQSAEAPSFRKGSEAYNMWRDYCTPPWPRTLQLYFWQYPHSWVDFRFRTDLRGENHATVAQQSILHQRQRAIDLHASDPAKYDMIGSNCWGWTAASSSGNSSNLWGWYRQMAPWGLWLDGIWLDDEYASDSGSITPVALPACMIYAGTETMACMKYIYEQFYVNGWDPGRGERGVWSDRYGFLNCLNKGTPYVSYWNPAVSNRFHPVSAGIDHGPNVLLLENYKIGSTWRWFMQNTNIAAGMYTTGFGPPDHVTYAAFSNQVNEFGGSFGSWNNDATPVTVSYVSNTAFNAYVRDYGVRAEADHSDEGMWIDLGNGDQRAQAVVSFWIRGGGQEQIEVGLKDQFGKEPKVNLLDYTGGTMPTNWTEVKIPIEKFCLTGNVVNDAWPGSLGALTFAFVNSGGGTIDVDYVAFTRDTIAPARPTNSFGAASAGGRARLVWDPSGAERDVVGYHVWRRHSATSGFGRVTARLVPAYVGAWEDTSTVMRAGQEVRYAIQAVDNAEPQNASAFAFEKTLTGGQLDVDWRNGRNPNVLGGQSDGYWGGGGPESFGFVYTNGPGGSLQWVRRSYVSSAWSGHYIDLAEGDVADYWALSFWVRGGAGGEQIDIGLRDSDDQERKLHLDDFLEGGSLSVSWQHVTIPLSEFTNVNLAAVRNGSFTHQAAGEIFVAGIAFVPGQRPLLVNNSFTEAEAWTRQVGTTTQDFKSAASAGEVLGWGWGADGGDYADYEFFLARPMTDAVFHARYACDAGDGRAFEVRWDDGYRASIACTNTGGWGDSSNDFSWVAASIGNLSTNQHKLTVVAVGSDEPVNLDCWYLSGGDGAYFRECEDHDYAAGSGGRDLKAGASGGEVLGESWGIPEGSVAVYSNVDAGAQAAAWVHLWYALSWPTGRAVEVYVDGVRRARLICSGTSGWGDRVSHFDRASARLGELANGGHVVTMAVPEGGVPVNLDCFYIGPEPPAGMGVDGDGDGLTDRQEGAAGTSAYVSDTDGDGFTDADELAWGAWGQVTDPRKADTDDDGLDDRQEWICGTDPCDADSFFQCLENTPGSFPMFGKLVRWSSSTGRVYSVYGLTNLLTSDIWPLTSGLPATPPVNLWTDDVSGAVSPLFYRIEVHR